MTQAERMQRTMRVLREIQSAPDTVDVCAACGQTLLTTPSDPPATLLCGVCLSSLERRREVRRANAELNMGGLF